MELKEVVAEQALDLRLLKKSMTEDGGDVEQSHLPVRRTVDKLGILPGSFYRWYDRYQTGGIEAL